MTHPWLPMTYCRDANCWMVHLEERQYPIYCGEWLEIRIFENKGIICRMELDRDWYVITTEAKFYLRKKDTYHIHN